MVEWIKPGLNIDWVGKRRTFLYLSSSACIGAIAVMLVSNFTRGEPVNYGTDFRGGSQIQVEFGKALDAAQIRAALKTAGFKDATVVKVTESKRPHFFMLRVSEVTAFTEGEQARVKAALGKLYGANLAGFEYSPGGDKVYVRFKRGYKRAARAIERGLTPESQPASAPASAPASQAASAPASAPATPAAQHAHESAIENEIERTFKASKVEATQVQRFGRGEDNVFEVSLAGLDRDVRKVFDGAFGPGTVKDVPHVEAVGPKMGKQLRDAGIKSVLYSLLLILVYVAFRFDFRYAPGGVIALLHDVVITTGVVALTWTEFSMTTVAALLTLAGYSINDTIVVYDRIRENHAKYRDRTLPQIINASITETLSRTILTSFTTILTSATMWVLGTGDVKVFSFVFTFGVVIGTYSSIAVASPLTLWLNDKFKALSAKAKA